MGRGGSNILFPTLKKCQEFYAVCLLHQHICPVTYGVRRDRVAHETFEIFMRLNCENCS